MDVDHNPLDFLTADNGGNYRRPLKEIKQGL